KTKSKMKTFELIREEQQQLEEAALREYVREGEKFAKATAKALGITVYEFSKTILKTIVKNPINSLVAAGFLAAYSLAPNATLTTVKGAWYGLMRLIVSPIYSHFNPLYTPIKSPWGRILTGPADGWEPVDQIIDGIGIGVLSIGGLMIALYGKEVGTKVNRAWNKSMEKSNIRAAKKADKKAVKALGKLITEK
ncbi:uncharacterized protein METZ01_LOCUS493805, partial [marine metagenome]